MATDRALSMYQSVLQKDTLNNEENSTSKIIDLKKALEQANAKIENANQLSIKYKNLYQKKLDECNQLQKKLDECNQLQQENKRLREAAETTKDDKLIVDRKKKSKQRTTKCPHGKSRVSK